VVGVVAAATLAEDPAEAGGLAGAAEADGEDADGPPDPAEPLQAATARPAVVASAAAVHRARVRMTSQYGQGHTRSGRLHLISIGPSPGLHTAARS
jgi:hypothetical protein